MNAKDNFKMEDIQFRISYLDAEGRNEKSYFLGKNFDAT
jgi:hypothetical protein